MEVPPFHSASAPPSGLRSSRTELPLNHQRPRVGQNKPPKWAKPSCQTQLLTIIEMEMAYVPDCSRLHGAVKD